MLKNCNTTKHYWKQLMALFLCVTIIAQLLPARVHAQEVTSTSDTTAAEQVSLDILGEDVTRRTATSKHYRTSDGG